MAEALLIASHGRCQTGRGSELNGAKDVDRGLNSQIFDGPT
jgi:hypothetical protein